MFEVTIGEYENHEVLGTFATRDEALRFLGQYALDHGDVVAPHYGMWEV